MPQDSSCTVVQSRIQNTEDFKKKQMESIETTIYILHLAESQLICMKELKGDTKYLILKTK